MKKHNNFHTYLGQQYIQAPLPIKSQAWQLGKFHSTGKERCNDNMTLTEELSLLLKKNPWIWPKDQIYFFSDLHADSDAFLASLVASGGVKKTGKSDRDFVLTKQGKKSRFIIGGDCFDKGPSNLRLLRSIRLLINRGAKVHILAGNHDIRVKLGMSSVELVKTPDSEHFFIRMGKKAIPFLKEIEQEYLKGKKVLKKIPNEDECRKRLFPSEDWFDNFPQVAKKFLPDKVIAKEVRRLTEKCCDFENDCKKAGLCLRTAYAAQQKWIELFLTPQGEFYWYFERMQLALHKGSFLFIHAGLDDKIAEMISKHGIKHLNRQFKNKVNKQLFEFYYGALANTIRTKYRDIDMPMTRNGVRMINERGIYAIVHGHKNMRFGQRIMLRKGLVNFECDASVDKNTRKEERLGSFGAAVTIFKPQGRVLGISTDYPYIKDFNPEQLLAV